MLRRVSARFNGVTPTLGPPRSVFQPRTVFAPGDAEGHAGVEMLIWSHGKSKAAVLVCTQSLHTHRVSSVLLAFGADFFFSFPFPLRS